MASPTSAERTAFSLDVLGRYVCNGLDEALRSAAAMPAAQDGSPQNDARAFDIVVIGGGTFGAAVASHIFNADKAHRHRVLVLEGGPFLLTEHLQDLPMIGLNVPGATSIAALRAARQDFQPREEVWACVALQHAVCRPGVLRRRPLALLGRLVAATNRYRDADRPRPRPRPGASDRRRRSQQPVF